MLLFLHFNLWEISRLQSHGKENQATKKYFCNQFGTKIGNAMKYQIWNATQLEFSLAVMGVLVSTNVVCERLSVMH